jgi:dephospho-CoA kinase
MLKTIGITGGVGAGKSKVLSYLKDNYNCRIIMADEVAHLLYCRGELCYKKLVELLGIEVLDKQGNIDKAKMASMIFARNDLLEKVNKIVHPMVKEYIINELDLEKERQNFDFVFVEAALLLEEHYDEFLDEVWYIYASVETRKARLMENRHYSMEKIDSIMSKQLSEDEFRRRSQQVISNDGDLKETCEDIDRIMAKYK